MASQAGVASIRQQPSPEEVQQAQDIVKKKATIASDTPLVPKTAPSLEEVAQAEQTDRLAGDPLYNADTQPMIDQALAEGRESAGDDPWNYPNAWAARQRSEARERVQAQVEARRAKAKAARSGRPGWNPAFRDSEAQNRPLDFGGNPMEEGASMMDAGIAGGRVMPTRPMTAEQEQTARSEQADIQARIDADPEIQARMDAARQKREDYLGSKAYRKSQKEDDVIQDRITEREMGKAEQRRARLEQRRWANTPRPMTAIDSAIASGNPEVAARIFEAQQRGQIAQAQIGSQERMAQAGNEVAREGIASNERTEGARNESAERQVKTEAKSRERTAETVAQSQQKIAELDTSTRKGIAELEARTDEAIADKTTKSQEKIADIQAKVEKDRNKLLKKEGKRTLKQSEQQHLERLTQMQIQLEETKNRNNIAQQEMDMAKDQMVEEELAQWQQRNPNATDSQIQRQRQRIQERRTGTGPPSPQTAGQYSEPAFEIPQWALDPETNELIDDSTLRKRAKQYIRDPKEREEFYEKASGRAGASDSQPTGQGYWGATIGGASPIVAGYNMIDAWRSEEGLGNKLQGMIGQTPPAKVFNWLFR
jgi:hypothetical protein